ncbi:uncharacterized protein [Eurosta solidaginis]|uniref:uncharacterized protein n=1 Tax=Eurosta solidaginis TaxID=178769 RepID=UPI003530FDA3
MPNPHRCCNPLQKKNHCRVYIDLVQVNEKYSEKFSGLIGQYICRSCKRALFKAKSSELENMSIEKDAINSRDSSPEKIIVPDDDVNANLHFDSEIVDKLISVDKINNLFEQCDVSPVKVRRISNFSKEEKEKLAAKLDLVGTTCDSSLSSEMPPEDENIEALRISFNNQKTRGDKINILTFVPKTWTIRKIRETFNVSRRMVSTAKKLQKTQGVGSRPEKKKGRPINPETVKAVEEFYLCDDVSRIIPGMHDSKSVKKDGVRCHEQKRLLMDSIRNLHSIFREKFPNMPISLSKFKQLRPQQCIFVGNA